MAVTTPAGDNFRAMVVCLQRPDSKRTDIVRQLMFAPYQRWPWMIRLPPA